MLASKTTVKSGQQLRWNLEPKHAEIWRYSYTKMMPHTMVKSGTKNAGSCSPKQALESGHQLKCVCGTVNNKEYIIQLICLWKFGHQCPTSPLLPPRKVPLEDLIYTSCTDPIPQPAAARTPRLHQPSTVTHLFYAYVRKTTNTEFNIVVLGRDLILLTAESFSSVHSRITVLCSTADSADVKVADPPVVSTADPDFLLLQLVHLSLSAPAVDFGHQCPTSPLLPPRKVPLEDLIYISCTDPIPQPAAARTPRLHHPSAVTNLFYAYVRKATNTEFNIVVLGRDLILAFCHLVSATAEPCLPAAGLVIPAAGTLTRNSWCNFALALQTLNRLLLIAIIDPTIDVPAGYYHRKIHRLNLSVKEKRCRIHLSKRHRLTTANIKFQRLLTAESFSSVHSRITVLCSTADSADVKVADPPIVSTADPDFLLLQLVHLSLSAPAGRCHTAGRGGNPVGGAPGGGHTAGRGGNPVGGAPGGDYSYFRHSLVRNSIRNGSSYISNALQINFDSVLGITDNTEMVTMFKTLESTGLRGFLGCPSVLYERELEQFFDTAMVKDGDITCEVSGKVVVISEDRFAGVFGLPTEGLVNLSEVPKDLVYDARSFFSQSGEHISTYGKKRLMKYEYRLLNDILAKSTVKAGSFDVVTHERFLMMTAIHFGIQVNWSKILFGVLKEMVDKTLKKAKGFAAQICVLLKGDPKPLML
ncbi:hypothetical protein F511_31548 [Dorcoceras hygrometricum]|uniref:Dystroglycan-like n=1 Tax=Dorcoceras hygrometricum TaxID=472368 RepID=A0A2Z7APG6_9LAMI|nr:hypothetical protein F511_31548 [Dorcoceras hygrometricum]